MKPLRLVFLGSDAIALPLLEWLAGPEGARLVTIVAVFTQPDRPVGRGQQVRPNEIKTWALACGLPVLQPVKLGAEERARLAGFEPDLGVVMAYGHLLRDEFIATPRLGMVNLHTSILPRYRGASPIQSAIASGERETGVTLMRIIRKLDAGPVADVERVAIEPLDTTGEVEVRLAAASARVVARALPRLADGALAFVPQDESRATYCRKLTKDDGAIDFGVPARTLAARINGLFPWPGCAIELEGQIVKLGLAEVSVPSIAIDPSSPGTVLAGDGHGLYIATGDGVLRLLRLQRPGGRMLAAGEFLRGFPVPPGTIVPSRPMPVLVTTR